MGPSYCWFSIRSSFCGSSIERSAQCLSRLEDTEHGWSRLLHIPSCTDGARQVPAASPGTLMLGTPETYPFRMSIVHGVVFPQHWLTEDEQLRTKWLRHVQR